MMSKPDSRYVISEQMDLLIRALYQGPLEEKPWFTFLNLLCQAVDSEYATLMLRPPREGDSGLVLNAVVASDNAYNDYNDTYFALDPFVDLPPGKAFSLREFVPDSELQHSAFYLQYMKPIGVHFIMGADMYGDDGMNARLRVTRAESIGSFADSEKTLVESLLPHLEQAIKLHSELSRVETERRLFSEAIGQLRVGAIVLNEEQRVIQHNEMARQLLQGDAPVALRDDRLMFASRSHNESFRQLVEEVFDAHLRSEPGFVRTFRVAKEESLGSLGLLVRPVARTESSGGKGNPSVVIFLSDPEEVRPASTKILAELFGFTPAESHLALLLTHGMTVDDACEDLGISRNTAKSHLSAMFSKTGVARQTQLIRLLLKSVASLGE